MPDPNARAQSALPPLVVPMDTRAIVARIDQASRRGRMPGFDARPPAGLFRVDAWGTPFDHDLIVSAAAGDDGTRLDFALRMRRRSPSIHAIILLVTVWPGVWLTDSMLRLWFDWYNALAQKPVFMLDEFSIFTYLWYLPLCVLPLPWYWRAIMRRSRRTARVSALEMIAKIAAELGVKPPPDAAAALEANKSPPA